MSPATPVKSDAPLSILSQISTVRSQIDPTQQLLLVTLGMGILTLAIGVMMIQMPWQERRQQLTSLYSEENERSELLLAIQRQKANLQEIEGAFLLKGGAPSLANEISNLANQTGLQINSIMPRPEVAADPYARFQLEILATGNLANLIRFLKTLEDDRPLLWVEQLDIGGPLTETSSAVFDEKSVFQPKEQQEIRLLLGAVDRQKVSR